jgi:hypothetical protein
VTLRALTAPVVAAALVLVATVAGSSPAARVDSRDLDLLTSAHPTGAQQVVVDKAYDVQARSQVTDVAADTGALTSSTCDRCSGESVSLHVVYADQAVRAHLDNVANAWVQDCRSCVATALSVQVVVLRGRPTTEPNNRAVSTTAACNGCRAAALAFQVVLVADDAEPLSDAEVDELRAWVDQQATDLRTSVLGPFGTLPDPVPDPVPTPEVTPTAEPTPTPTTPFGTRTGDRRARRDAGSALAELKRLLTTSLGARAVATDVEVSR